MPPSTAPDDAQRALFARTLGDSIAASGMKLDEIVRRLTERGATTSTATLSYWQNGHSYPRRGRSLLVVAALEEVLSLPQGALTSLLSGGEGPRWTSPPSMLLEEQRTMALLQSWGMDLGGQHRHLMMQTSWFIDADRLGARELSRTVSQVEGESESRFPVVVADIPGRPTPRVVALHGCTLGRSGSVARGSTFIGEMILPRTLGHHEVYWTELEYHWGQGLQPRERMTTALGATVPLLSLDITFAGDPPLSLRHGSGADYVPGEGTPVPLVGGSGQIVLTNPEPGLHWFEWADPGSQS